MPKKDPAKKKKKKIVIKNKDSSKGINIKIKIDQSKKTNTTGKPQKQYRQLPAFSAPIGPNLSALGTISRPMIQDSPIVNTHDNNQKDLMMNVFNRIIEENRNNLQMLMDSNRQVTDLKTQPNLAPTITNPLITKNTDFESQNQLIKNPSIVEQVIDNQFYDDPRSNNQFVEPLIDESKWNIKTPQTLPKVTSGITLIDEFDKTDNSIANITTPKIIELKNNEDIKEKSTKKIIKITEEEIEEGKRLYEQKGYDKKEKELKAKQAQQEINRITIEYNDNVSKLEQRLANAEGFKKEYLQIYNNLINKKGEIIDLDDKKIINDYLKNFNSKINLSSHKYPTPIINYLNTQGFSPGEIDQQINNLKEDLDNKINDLTLKFDEDLKKYN